MRRKADKDVFNEITNADLWASLQDLKKDVLEIKETFGKEVVAVKADLIQIKADIIQWKWVSGIAMSLSVAVAGTLMRMKGLF